MAVSKKKKIILFWRLTYNIYKKVFLKYQSHFRVSSIVLCSGCGNEFLSYFHSKNSSNPGDNGRTQEK